MGSSISLQIPWRTWQSARYCFIRRGWSTRRRRTKRRHRELEELTVSSFYFKAVAADGKLRTGNLSRDSDKAVARELRNQGRTPGYVGLAQKKCFEPNLPDFTRGRHR